MNDKTMPELPEAAVPDGLKVLRSCTIVGDLYTAAQMHAYAQAYAAAQTPPRSDYCALEGCLHAAHGCPAWPAGTSPFTPRRGEGVVTEGMVPAEATAAMISARPSWVDAGEAEAIWDAMASAALAARGGETE